ncbi:4-oxalomesaconate tautomerase [Xanthomonas campestris pv. campestris]|uniref:4-oxalomesaconate tautomerase n=1 Tax=Xanthomonas campestris TaxID=339 RepID=UPI001A14BA9F|nr:4-oxalomesaconate tautomerase [Xanthomonas campestris]MBF9174247.1 4-oxalomesaconate tautomerase [Xanthomonas campestris pv. campestris]MDO0846416.1 4-oxalomesaconate tautomerase [Xanthomonas campestris pv. campestris]MEB1414710.1 4-oxalomesaconate tautomerase [Xanthomonas campestris pv. campestris]MEB1460504.1 4-oxalomesaconate tautomerase [Xanthomonas campestris pv. campestris]MEB1501674.1 4-oxalomesaconate tautomerase [Xanthomonas campestris pv. campestris]
MSEGVRAMWMRGGTSKGGFFLAADLPADTAARDAFLLRAYGSPDLRQIDGMGGADPLTSKVAVVSRSAREDADVDYLFLQVSVDQAQVSDAQNCGNLLAGVGPFALERGLLPAQDGQTAVGIFMRNTGTVATATVCTPGGQVTYTGNTRIDGVPGTAAPIALAFAEIAGSSCGALLPTGNPVDLLDGIAVTLIDNGMPCVVLRASDVGIRGDEDRATLDADVALKARLETLRLQAGPLMRLGDVDTATVPKLMLVSAPHNGGAITVRSFIPHRCHASIGVLGAVTVATACLLPGTPAHALAQLPGGTTQQLEIEHPSGASSCLIALDAHGNVVRAAVVRTARKLFDGVLFG